ncbi:hypothetical protein CBS101457_002987 [Exobasidium rhododendri]|nr:hypothetical protein CBS101457_002987 [Exobasidium rhododendri]
MGRAQHMIANTDDAAVIGCSSSFQPTTNKIFRDWFEGRMGKKVFSVGAMHTIDPLDSVDDEDEGKSADESMVFLRTASTRWGLGSVVYVAFGSMIFPSHHPEQFPAFVQALFEGDNARPCIFSLSQSIQDSLPEETKSVMEKASQNGLLHLSTWVPQTRILQDEAVGCFVTHAGSNSMFESMCASKPMVAWPHSGDGPAIAVYHSEVLDTSWELLQIRGPTACEPLRSRKSRSVSSSSPHFKALGEPSAIKKEVERVLLGEAQPHNPTYHRKRANAEKLGKTIKGEFSPSGEVRRELERLQAVSASLTM